MQKVLTIGEVLVEIVATTRGDGFLQAQPLVGPFHSGAPAIVVDGAEILNPGGLRRADEFVRHKMLDALGDLALAGAPILGAYTGVRAGHGVTNRLLRKLFATEGAWEVVMLDAEEASFLPGAGVDVADIARAG